MAIEIREIQPTRGNLKKFIKFGINLYKGNNCFVPPLVMDEIGTLDPKQNPATEFCDSVLYMAYRDGKPVGRIAGIINKAANERWNESNVRFGFVDFIDDNEVVDALFKAVEDWGRSKGLKQIVGPLGFTDMDPEGMLIEGFDEEGTMATIYNYPYYQTQVERLGFEKEADWIEFRVTVPDQIPEKMVRVCEIVKKKTGVRNIRCSSKKELVEKYGRAIFELINEAYVNLYGFVPLSERQIDHYIKMYIPVLRLEDISLIVDANDVLVGVGISIPSLSKALIKSRGKLFPTGWIHLLKALRSKNDVVDLMLVAVKPEYQSRGVNSLLFNDLIPYFQRVKYKFAETNVELETNQKVTSQWQYFDYRQHKRRRAYKKPL